MEEHVGQLWHRFISRIARTGHPEAAVCLNEVSRTTGVLFRALGGDGGLRIEAAEGTAYESRRGWLRRIADSRNHVELAWRDERSLRLPARIDVFPERILNRSLYLWLAALAAADSGEYDRPWLARSQQLTLETLARYPGLMPRYRELVEAQLAVRTAPENLPDEEAPQEAAIRAALLEPGSVENLPPANKPPQPVHLWLHPAPPIPAGAVATQAADPEDAPEADGPARKAESRRRHAERVEQMERNRGLIAVRMENIFGWGEHAHVDRGTEEDEDTSEAERMADDLDTMSVTQDQQTVASRVKFDLDLPSAASDDRRLGPGIPLPEWDYRRTTLRPDYCRLQPMVAADAPPAELPDRLSRLARRLRNQFQALAPSRVWYRAQPDGSEVDLEAYERFIAQRAAGKADSDGRLYRDFRSGGRDLACLLLADLSLSTDTWVNNDARVVDVIRDTLFLFSEAMSSTADRFGLYGFSSRHRDHVRFHILKDFREPYNRVVRGRLAALKPGFYTRMGAAIRHATSLLAKQPASQRLLLLLTDGKPNDLDQYEGRYGIEDTRMAVIEARRQGLRPFCVTIDDEGGDYLPHLFGASGYVVIRRPSELPRRLPQLYLQLTR